MKNQIIYYTLLVLFFVSCKLPPTDEKVDTIIDAIKQEFAPDKRVAEFQIAYTNQTDGLVVKGTTNLPKAKEKLFSELTAAGFTIIDSLENLPQANMGKKTYGVVNVSVCNICLLYTSPSPRDATLSRMPSSA